MRTLLLAVVDFVAVVCASTLLADNLPLPPGEARTPETRSLTAEESVRALERDWLFQAMGQPLLSRAEAEIGWARELAARLSRLRQAPELSAELRELDDLEKQLRELRGQPAAAISNNQAEVVPSWIWYPEGQPAEDAPAEARFFRCRFEVPAEVRAGVLRIAADDACEVFVNGTRVGQHETWQRAGVFDVEGLLKDGDNLLAVRAENRPAPSKNPAGLIARLVVTRDSGEPWAVVSDGSWRARMRCAQWEQRAFDDSAWKAALVTAPFGGGPWGKIAALEKADLQDDPVAAYADSDSAARELYFAVRRVKRDILFKNPVLDFTQLLFIDQPLPQGPESRHEAIHRMGIMAVPGGRLLVLDGLHPGGQLRQLAPGEAGQFLAARSVVRCHEGPLLLQAARREELSSVRDEHRRHAACGS